MRDLILAPSYAAATAYNVQQASASASGAFGVCAQPINAWLEKLWEQFGDGRKLVSPVHAQVAADKVLHARTTEHLAITPGLAKALCDCARLGFGSPVLDAYVEGGAGYEDLSAAEQELMVCLRDYRAELAAHGYIEQGDAWAFLAAQPEELAAVLPNPLHVRLLSDAPLTAAQQAFFDAFPNIQVEKPASTVLEPLGQAPCEDVRFAFSAGPYARPSVVLQVLEDVLRQNPDARIVITAKDALGLYGHLEPALTRMGVAINVRSVTRPFALTAFGKTFCAALSASKDGLPWNKDALTTLLHSCLSGARKSIVWKHDAALRGDRLLPRDEALRILLESDETAGWSPWTRAATVYRSAIGAISADRAAVFDAALDGALQRMGSSGVSEAFVREQSTACQVVRTLYGVLEEFDYMDAEAFARLADSVCVPVSRANYVQEAAHPAQVAFMPLNRAAACAPASADTLIVCDLSSESYPLREERSAAALLLERLGAVQGESSLVRARRQYRALIAVPRTSLVLERSLNNEKGESLYPAAMWEEFVDVYRDVDDLTDRSDLDESYGLPERFMATRYDAGEDDVWSDVCPGIDESALALADANAPEVQAGLPSFAERIGFPYASIDPRSSEAHVRISPSQVETYMECPRKWFISRRLATRGLDEDIGPLEQGTFLHSILQVFYERFGKKVTEANRDEAERLMFGADGAPGLFDELVEAQYAKKPGFRYAPLKGTSEMYRFAQQRKRVRSWLDFEVGFLPGFTPVAFECKVPEQLYANALVRGKIDRIDIDEQGRAVIIDYKGGLDKSLYNPLDGNASALQEAGKVQGLMYAGLIEGKTLAVFPSQLGGSTHVHAELIDSSSEAFDALPSGVRTYPISQVVGVLYVSYSKGNKVDGALDAFVIGTSDVPTLESWAQSSLPPASSDSPLAGFGFSDLISHTEQRVSEAIAHIEAGYVEAHPSSNASCKYCPLLDCERRLS